MNSKLEKYTNWLLAPFLAGSFYLILYISSHFSGEIFSWKSVFLFTVLIFFMMYIVRKYLRWQQKKQSQVTLGLSSFGTALLLIIGTYLLLYIIAKSFLIVYSPQNDSISLWHLSLIFAIAFLLGIIIVGSQFLLQYINAWGTAQLKAERLQKENTQARLASLKLQLNPHFLFNNFHTLNGLIHEDPKEASDFLIELAELYRAILKYENDEIILLEKEIKLIEHFNFLMKKRFAENYHCHIDLEKTLLQTVYVPPMSIQLLVENAVKHNRIDNTHQLNVQIYEEDNYLYVTNKIHKKLQTQKTSGIGLENLKSRYEILSNLVLKIGDDGKEFRVGIPLIQVIEK